MKRRKVKENSNRENRNKTLETRMILADCWLSPNFYPCIHGNSISWRARVRVRISGDDRGKT
jgi:hypothetical protein